MTFGRLRSPGEFDEEAAASQPAARAGTSDPGTPTTKALSIAFSALVIAVMIGVGLAYEHFFRVSGETLVLASQARRNLMSGELSALGSRETAAFLWAWSSRVLNPLAVVATMFLIERLIGPKQRAAKNYFLIAFVQLAYVTSTIFLVSLTTKAGLMPEKPLVTVGPASNPWANVALSASAFILILFVGDILRYWLHRAQHVVPLLWRFHSIHHSPSDLDVLHNVIHPLEYLTTVIIIGVPVGFLVGVDHDSIYWIAGAVTIETHLVHMNSPVHFGRFGKVIMDNRHHFLHHSCDPADFNCNFASMFPVLDMIFGTYKTPAAGPLPRTGFEESRPTRLRDYVIGHESAQALAVSGRRSAPQALNAPAINF